jgi:hypothetical protein
MVIRALAFGNNFYALKSFGACQSVNQAKQTESIFISGCPSGPLPANVFALGAVADFGAQNCQYTPKFDAR